MANALRSLGFELVGRMLPAPVDPAKLVFRNRYGSVLVDMSGFDDESPSDERTIAPMTRWLVLADRLAVAVAVDLVVLYVLIFAR